MCVVFCLAADAAEDTGRDLLFTDPTVALPDVYISQSVMYLTEGETFGYTVKLTHQPGVREDDSNNSVWGREIGRLSSVDSLDHNVVE